MYGVTKVKPCFVVAVEPKERRDQLKNPLWIEDKALRKGKVEYLPPNEIQFWKDLIGQYLWPLDEDKEEKVRRMSYCTGRYPPNKHACTQPPHYISY